MRGVSVAIVGGGRWARALSMRLTRAQREPGAVAGKLRRVMQYQPPDNLPRIDTHFDTPGRAERPKAAPPPSSRSGGDATLQVSADALLFAAGEIYADTIELRELVEADLIILAVPAAKVKPLLETLRGVLKPKQCLVHAIGSFAPVIGEHGHTMMPVSELIRLETGFVHLGALGGPALAEDLEEDLPVALLCGSPSQEVQTQVQQALAGPQFRVYTSPDLIGVEIARALSGVMALACGIADSLGFGPAARALLVSHATSEMTRIGLAFGGSEWTFFGPAGLGELIAATDRRGTPDFQLGRLLGRGVSLGDAHRQIDRACDGLNMVREAQILAQRARINLPIVNALYRWVSGKQDLRTSMNDLLARDLFT